MPSGVMASKLGSSSCCMVTAVILATAVSVQGLFTRSIKPLPTTEHNTGWPVKFRNFASRPMKLYWVNFDGSARMSGPDALPANGGTLSFQTFRTHEFFWAEADADPPIETDADGRVGSRMHITDTVRMYYYMDDSTTKESRASLKEELEHMARYRAQTGRHWVAVSWPRPKPIYEMWEPDRVGQTFDIDLSSISNTGQYTCTSQNVEECYTGGTGKKRGQLDTSKVKQTPLGNLTLEVMSLEPMAFRVLNFLSEFEADYMISEATPLLHDSTTGNGKDAKVQSDLRRSKSAWLHHGHSNVVDTIYRRLGVMTKVGPDLMDAQHVEAMNVLKYPKGGQYNDHFDWTADGTPETRFISGLVYLNDPAKGGATSFPRARMPNGKWGTKVPPSKCQLMFFYDLLPDGNADELSYHAGLPVDEGHKWISPVWIWEPRR